MKYSIGDVARCLGFTPAGLHYFEKEGLMESVKGSETRRQYSIADFYRLVSYRKYRAMGLPLKEIASQFSRTGNTRQEIAEKMRNQSAAARETAARCMASGDEIDWFADSIESSAGRVGMIDLTPMPQGTIYSPGDLGWISRSREDQRHIAAWINHMPFTRLGICSPETGSARLCYFIRQGIELPSEPEGLLVSPKCIALHTYTVQNRELIENVDRVFEPLWKYASKHSMHQAGTGLSVNLCVECHGDELDTLSEVWLPVALNDEHIED